jgi:hypothetical protein
MKKRFLVAVFTVLLAGTFSQQSSAVGAHTLTVTPSITDVSIDPGTTATKRVTVANQGEKDFSLQLSVTSYSVTNEQYETTFEPIEGRAPVDEWIQFSAPAKSDLKSSKYLDVDLTVAVPADTPPGGYSAVLMVESGLGQKQTNGVVAKNRIAHIVYINVNGPVERKGIVEASRLPYIAFSGKQIIQHTAINLGGTNEKTKVDVLVKDVFGRPVSGQLVERYVLPGTKRKIETAWDGSAVFGVYNVTVSSEIAGQDSSQPSYWMLVIHPVFLFVAVIAITASVWLRFSRFVSMKSRKKS